ncbi:MAG: ABC transporter ATP-binding protein [Acidimicrobiia bacterium]
MTTTDATGSPLLEVRGLRKEFPRRAAWRRSLSPIVAVDGVDLTLDRGETLGIVGESGSGKSTTARMVLRLIEPTAGTVRFDGRDLTALGGRDLRRVRRDLQAVFQDVTGSLDPLMNVSQLLAEPLREHRGLAGEGARRRVTELLDMVGLPRAFASRYAHELSGGQRQRVNIARALAVEPKLMVLDEPVSALDVSTQAQVINLLSDLQAELGVAYLLIAHDLFVVHHVSTRIAVMYLGVVVEQGTADQLYARPRHPYTEALLSAVPVPPTSAHARERITLQGEVPSAHAVPPGCRFHTRCPYVMEVCRTEVPALVAFEDGGSVACHLHTTGPELTGASVELVPAPAGTRPAVPQDGVAP